MPTSCSAPGCTQRFVKGFDIHFYRFPKDVERKVRWQTALKRVQINSPNKLWEPADHDRLCSLHFVSGKPSTKPDHPDDVPSLFNFTPGPMKCKTPRSVDRFERANKRRRRLVLSPISAKENIATSNNPVAEETAAEALLSLGQELPQRKHDAATQTEDTLQEKFDALQQDHEGLKKEYQRLLNENRELKEQINNSKFTYTNLNNSQMLSLTGLISVAVFSTLMTLLSMCYKPVGKLCKGDMLLLVLMKLRLNLTNKDLALRFQIAPSQVSTTLCRCRPVFAERLKFLIKWPSKDVILRNMPKSFRKHRKCRVIIDCSEVFIQRPTNLSTRAKTWSNYKHHNTLKFLIGVTPYGAVCFISKCWGGRVSDKEITEKSGFMTNLNLVIKF